MAPLPSSAMCESLTMAQDQSLSNISDLPDKGKSWRESWGELILILDLTTLISLLCYIDLARDLQYSRGY